MTRLQSTAVVLLFLFFGTNSSAQVINATLSGTVSDGSGALIPGVEITAMHTATGVVSMVVTNESGTYRFANPPISRNNLLGFRVAALSGLSPTEALEAKKAG